MVRHLPLDHFCPWREEAEELRERVTSLEAKTAVLERHVFGRKTERLPGIEQQLRREQAGEDNEERRQRAPHVSLTLTVRGIEVVVVPSSLGCSTCPRTRPIPHRVDGAQERPSSRR